MDARPVRTHYGAYKAFRIPGIIATAFGGVVLAYSSFSLLYSLFERFLFNNTTKEAEWIFIAAIVSCVLCAMILASGIVLLVMSEKMRILDGHKGVDYQKL